MTITVPTWVDPPHSDHATIGEAGDCPQCRAWAIRSSKDGPHGFPADVPAGRRRPGRTHSDP